MINYLPKMSLKASVRSKRDLRTSKHFKVFVARKVSSVLTPKLTKMAASGSSGSLNSDSDTGMNISDKKKIKNLEEQVLATVNRCNVQVVNINHSAWFIKQYCDMVGAELFREQFALK